VRFREFFALHGQSDPHSVDVKLNVGRKLRVPLLDGRGSEERRGWGEDGIPTLTGGV
jgi:hypothetical protein